MSKREPQIIACHPDGYTEHISEAEAHERVTDGEATWRGPDSIVFYPAFQPNPGTPKASTRSRLSCKVGKTLANAYRRDRNKEGWAYVAVQHIRNQRETPSYQQAEVLQLGYRTPLYSRARARGEFWAR